MSLHDFVSAFANEKPALRRRLATVKSVEADYTLTATLNGTDVSGIRYFGHYVPVAGAQVWLDTDGGDLVAVGAIAGRGGRGFGAYAYKGADQTIADNSLVQVTLSAVDFDSETIFDNASDVMTLRRAGLWLVQAGASFAANATGYREIQIRGTGIVSGDIATVRTAASPTTNTRLTTSAVRYFTYGDTVELRARQTSGGSLAVAGDGNPQTTWLSAVYLGPGL